MMTIKALGVKYCPNCTGAALVYDSRLTAQGYIRRRRRCHKCNHRWNTIEVPGDAFTPKNTEALVQGLRDIGTLVLKTLRVSHTPDSS